MVRYFIFVNVLYHVLYHVISTCLYVFTCEVVPAGRLRSVIIVVDCTCIIFGGVDLSSWFHHSIPHHSAGIYDLHLLSDKTFCIKTF